VSDDAGATVTERPSYKLPIRFVPRHDAQIFRLVMFAIVGGFGILWLVKVGGMVDARRSGTPLAWLYALPMLPGWLPLAIGVLGIARTLVKWLPGSPLYHLEVDATGVTIRALWRRHFAWTALSPFAVSVKKRGTRKDGYTREYSVVALPAADHAILYDEYERRQRAILRIDGDEYGAADMERDCTDLAQWLNQLRELAMNRKLFPDDTIYAPAGFRTIQSRRPSAVYGGSVVRR
jgi:hypothetical protein